MNCGRDSDCRFLGPLKVPDAAHGSTIEVMKVDVGCYAGRKADERPVRFVLEGQPYSVEDVLDQWYEPDSIYYKVRADDGNLYILRQRTSSTDDPWKLVSFREDKGR